MSDLQTVGNELPPPTLEEIQPAQAFEDSAAWCDQWLDRFTALPDTWCDRWAEHPEAAARIHALWEAWETAFADGGGAMSTWWLIHHAGHMDVLASSRGPFARCHNGHVPHTPRSRR